MARCCVSLVASIFTWLAALLYISAFGLDWWALTGENSANLFSYTMSSSRSVSSSISYSWSLICQDPFCSDCQYTNIALSDPLCDTRSPDPEGHEGSAELQCSNQRPSPVNWCDAMNRSDCRQMWTEACVKSAEGYYSEEPEALASATNACALVTHMGGACSLVQACAGVTGTAMGISIVTALLAIVVTVLTCDSKKSHVGRILAIVTSALLVLELCLGVTGFSLGFKWTQQLPESSVLPGVWCSLSALVANLLALGLYVLVAALNNADRGAAKERDKDKGAAQAAKKAGPARPNGAGSQLGETNAHGNSSSSS